MNAGEDPFIAQYLIERSRAVGLPWTYGGTPAVLSQYVKVGQGGPDSLYLFRPCVPDGYFGAGAIGL